MNAVVIPTLIHYPEIHEWHDLRIHPICTCQHLQHLPAMNQVGLTPGSLLLAAPRVAISIYTVLVLQFHSLDQNAWDPMASYFNLHKTQSVLATAFTPTNPDAQDKKSSVRYESEIGNEPNANLSYNQNSR